MQQDSIVPRFTIKASLGAEIRRFNLEKSDFSVLKETCIRVFALPPSASPVFKYTDDENDVVTISSSAELAEAFRVHADLLRIAVDVTPSVVPAPRPRDPLAVSKPHAKPVVVKTFPPKASGADLKSSIVSGPVTVVPAAPIAAPVAPAAAAPAAAVATHVPAVAAPASAAAASDAAVPAPAPIHSTANATPYSPSAPSSSPANFDADIAAARAELDDIRTRFQAARDKPEKARLRPLLMAAKGRVMALHVAAKSHRVSMQMQRKQEKMAAKIEQKAVKKTEKLEEKLEKKEEKLDKKAEKLAKKDSAASSPAAAPAKGLKEQMLLGRFVRDVTIPDGFEMDGGRAFVKTWRFRNDSTRAWSTGTRLLFVGKNSDRMGALDSLPISAALQPGEECDVSVSLVSPPEPGRYTAYFRLADAEGRKFGQRVWVQIHVTADSSSSSDESDKVVSAASATPVAVSAAAPSSSAPASEPSGEKMMKKKFLKNKREKPAYNPSDEELAKYGVHLRTLGSMGFLNTKRNLRLLNKFAGNLDRTVEVLLRKPEKNKPQATA